MEQQNDNFNRGNYAYKWITKMWGYNCRLIISVNLTTGLQLELKHLKKTKHHKFFPGLNFNYNNQFERSVVFYKHLFRPQHKLISISVKNYSTCQ